MSGELVQCLYSLVSGGGSGRNENVLEVLVDLRLFGGGEGADREEQRFNVHEGVLDEGGVVDVDEKSNEELAVHAIRDTAMARNELIEVLLFKGTFHGRSEETTEGSNDGRKKRNRNRVELNWHKGKIGQKAG